jgi:hypothetical protein
MDPPAPRRTSERSQSLDLALCETGGSIAGPVD